MHRLGFLALIFAVTFQSLTAQPADSLRYDGKRALVFYFDGLRLSGGLGGKYWINDYQFIRGSVRGSYDKEKTDHSIIDSTDFNSEYKDVSFDISLDFANRFDSIEGFLPYWGVRLGVQWYSRESITTDLSGTTQYSTQKRILFGGLFFGVEYFITSRISFSGEQRITVSFGKNSYNTKDWHINNSTSSLLLSVYL